MASNDDKRRPHMPRGGDDKPSRPRGAGRSNSSSSRRPDRASKRGQVESPRPKRTGPFASGVTMSMRALILVIVAAIALLVAVPVVLQWADQQRSRQALLGELEEAKATRIALEQDLKNWDNEEYVAAQARTRLGYVQRGETQFSVADAPVPEETEEDVAASKGPPRPWTIVLQEELKEADQVEP